MNRILLLEKGNESKYEKLTSKFQKIIYDVSELEISDKPLVFLGIHTAKILAETANKLRCVGFKFSHADFCFKNSVIAVSLLKIMKIYDFSDENNNRIIISPKINGSIGITFNRNIKNCEVNLGDIFVSSKLSIDMWGDNGIVSIGENTNLLELKISCGLNGKVEIGKDCMFSAQICLHQTDQHPVFDLATLERINIEKNIKIGNHVWLGRNVMLLGGAEIGDGAIVGSNAVTSSRFPANTIIAGCPAKVIRENIIWSKDLSDDTEIKVFSDVKDKIGMKYLENNDNQNTT